MVNDPRTRAESPIQVYSLVSDGFLVLLPLSCRARQGSAAPRPRGGWSRSGAGVTVRCCLCPHKRHERYGSTPASGKATNPRLCQTTERVISDELWLFYFLPCSGAPEVCFSQSHGNCFSSIRWYVGIRILKSLCEGVLRKTSKNHTI